MAKRALRVGLGHRVKLPINELARRGAILADGPRHVHFGGFECKKTFDEERGAEPAAAVLGENAGTGNQVKSGIRIRAEAGSCDDAGSMRERECCECLRSESLLDALVDGGGDFGEGSAPLLLEFERPVDQSMNFCFVFAGG